MLKHTFLFLTAFSFAACGKSAFLSSRAPAADQSNQAGSNGGAGEGKSGDGTNGSTLPGSGSGPDGAAGSGSGGPSGAAGSGSSPDGTAGSGSQAGSNSSVANGNSGNSSSGQSGASSSGVGSVGGSAGTTTFPACQPQSFATAQSFGIISSATQNLSHIWNGIQGAGRIIGSEANINTLKNSGLNPWWSSWQSGPADALASDGAKRSRLLIFAMNQELGGDYPNTQTAIYNTDTSYFVVKSTVNNTYVNVESLANLLAAAPGNYTTGNALWLRNAKLAFNAKLDLIKANPDWCR